MTWLTLLGLLSVTSGATMLGAFPVFFHRFMRPSHMVWWESFGGGVMVSASIFSLYLPAYELLQQAGQSLTALLAGSLVGLGFIFIAAILLHNLTKQKAHRAAYLVVLAMGLHNIPEGLAVGVDVAALGWQGAKTLAIAIFIQNLPEGLVSAMSFLVSGFSLRISLLACAATAVIEGAAALAGHSFVVLAAVGLPFLLSFAGACMMGVVLFERLGRRQEAAGFSYSGFVVGLSVCAALDFAL